MQFPVFQKYDKMFSVQCVFDAIPILLYPKPSDIFSYEFPSRFCCTRFDYPKKKTEHTNCLWGLSGKTAHRKKLKKEDSISTDGSGWPCSLHRKRAMTPESATKFKPKKKQKRQKSMQLSPESALAMDILSSVPKAEQNDDSKRKAVLLAAAEKRSLTPFDEPIVRSCQSLNHVDHHVPKWLFPVRKF